MLTFNLAPLETTNNEQFHSMQEVEELRDAIETPDNIPALQSSSSPLRVGESQSTPNPEFSPIPNKPVIHRKTQRKTAGVPPNRYDSTKQEFKSEEKKNSVNK